MKVAVVVTLLAMIFGACGKRYTFKYCDKKTFEAYYTMSADEERVICEVCAREYWMPFDYKDYKVK